MLSVSRPADTVNLDDPNHCQLSSVEDFLALSIMYNAATERRSWIKCPARSVTNTGVIFSLLRSAIYFSERLYRLTVGNHARCMGGELLFQRWRLLCASVYFIILCIFPVTYERYVTDVPSALDKLFQRFPDKTGTDKTGTVKTGTDKTGNVKTGMSVCNRRAPWPGGLTFRRYFCTIL